MSPWQPENQQHLRECLRDFMAKNVNAGMAARPANQKPLSLKDQEDRMLFEEMMWELIEKATTAAWNGRKPSDGGSRRGLTRIEVLYQSMGQDKDDFRNTFIVKKLWKELEMKLVSTPMLTLEILQMEVHQSAVAFRNSQLSSPKATTPRDIVWESLKLCQDPLCDNPDYIVSSFFPPTDQAVLHMRHVGLLNKSNPRAASQILAVLKSEPRVVENLFKMGQVSVRIASQPSAITLKPQQLQKPDWRKCYWVTVNGNAAPVGLDAPSVEALGRELLSRLGAQSLQRPLTTSEAEDLVSLVAAKERAPFSPDIDIRGVLLVALAPQFPRVHGGDLGTSDRVHEDGEETGRTPHGGRRGRMDDDPTSDGLLERSDQTAKLATLNQAVDQASRVLDVGQRSFMEETGALSAREAGQVLSISHTMVVKRRASVRAKVDAVAVAHGLNPEAFWDYFRKSIATKQTSKTKKKPTKKKPTKKKPTKKKPSGEPNR